MHVPVAGLMVVAGATASVFISAFGFCFFSLCFLTLCCGADGAACADGSPADGAGAVSAAQAGITIKDNNNSTTFFFMTSLPYGYKHGRLADMQPPDDN